jgi:hypothetical protein
MRYLFLILLIPMFQYKNIEFEVINDILMDLLGTDQYFESPGFSPSLPDGVDTTDLFLLRENLRIENDTTRIFYARDKKIVDSLQSYYDSILVHWYKENEDFNERLKNPKAEKQELVVIIGDSLIEPQKTIKENNIKKAGLKKEYSALIDLYLESNLKQESFNYINLTNTGRYKIYSATSKVRLKPSETFAWGIKFSRVIFNEKQDQAVVYVSLTCKGDCGYGKLLYLKKKNDRWIIENFDWLWVS